MLPELVRQHILERNTTLHNRHAGERCFIIATGPSIKDQDLRPLRNELCISLSNFFVHPDYGYIKPQYHCMAAYCNSCSEEGWDTWMQSLDMTIQQHNPETTLLFPLNDVKRNFRTETFVQQQSYYADLSTSEQELALQGIDLTRPIVAPQSVPIMAIQIALYMGVKEIYLLGCDHDWILSMYESRHFYQEEEHATSRYCNKNTEWENVDIEEQCRSYVALWQQYKLLRHLADQMGAKIYNATKGGLLDVFPRVSLAEVCSAAPPNTAPPVRPEGAYGFFGDFDSWSAAERQCEGYDAPQILEKVCASTLKVKHGEAVYERDSVLFDQVPLPWIEPLLTWLPRIAAGYDNRLNILDFGGSLGSTYFALKPFLGNLSDLKWGVVEQANFVECGNRLIADDSLRFYTSINQCIRERQPQVVLLSASLEYLERPYDLISAIIEHGPDYIIFDRTPIIAGDRDRLTAQFVPPQIYQASYPAWFFSQEKFLNAFSGSYEIIGDFQGQDIVNIPSEFKGFVFRKISAAAKTDPSWNPAERAQYEEAGKVIRQMDTAANKQQFLQQGCPSQQDIEALKARREVNRYLLDTALQRQLSTVMNKPIHAIFEMSSACNLNCTLCNTGALKRHFPNVKRGFMTFETFKAGLDKLLPEVESILLYNWGEPLLNKSAFDCVLYATKHYVGTQMSTNMMLYTEEIGGQMIKSGLQSLIVSCDGLDQATYESYRSGGDLQKVIAGVENLVALKKRLNSSLPLIQMQFIVFRQNENQMQEFKSFWKAKGVDSVNFINMSYMSSHGRELAEKLDFRPVNPAFQPHHPYGTVKNCGDFYSQVTVDWNGDWHTCCFPSGMPEYRIGNIVEDDFWSTWNSEKYQYCRSLVRDQKSGPGYCETMCHDCTGIFPRSDTKRYWSHDKAPGAEPVTDLAHLISSLPPDCSILETGFSQGLGYRYLKSASAGPLKYTGTEHDETGLAGARQQFPDASFFSSATNLFFKDGAFDMVICSDSDSRSYSPAYVDEIVRVASKTLLMAKSPRCVTPDVPLEDLLRARGFRRAAEYGFNSRSYRMYSR